MDKVRHSTVPAQLLLRHEYDVNGSPKCDLLALEEPQRSEILHANALHVLSSSREDSSRFIHDGIERFVRPILFENGHNVNVRI